MCLDATRKELEVPFVNGTVERFLARCELHLDDRFFLGRQRLFHVFLGLGLGVRGLGVRVKG